MSSPERSLEWWKLSVRNGIKFQQKYARSDLWAQYKSYYRHNFPKGIIPVNLVFSVLRTVVPQVYFRNPAVIITPTKPGLEYELHAKLVESIDNWLLRELSVKTQFKKMITDAFLCGIGNGFVGYDSEFGYSPKNLEGESAMTITQFDKKGYRVEYNSHVNPGMPWFLRARPEDVIYPWGCESAENAEWVAMRVFRPLDDIKADPKYKNTDKLVGSFTQKRTTAEGQQYADNFEQQLLDREWVELWQVRDAKTGEILAFTMDHNDFLRKEEDVLQIEGIPVETLTFNPDPDYIYGIPDTRIIEPQMLELNEIRTQAMKHRRVDIIKALVRKGVIKSTEIDKLLNEEVKAMVEIESDGPLSESVMMLQPGNSGILNDLASAGEIVRSDVRESIGFSRSSQGEYQGKTHISAKETDVVNWAKEIRLDERRDMVADLLSNVVRKFNQIIFANWKGPQVRSIVGPDGMKWWLQFTGAEIKGEYNVKVDPSNALPEDKRTKRQDAVEMAKAWSEMNQGQIQQGIPVPAEIQRFFFSQYDGINVDKLLAQSAPPQGGGMAPGMSPGMAVPPQMAAQLMSQQKAGGGMPGGR